MADDDVIDDVKEAFEEMSKEEGMELEHGEEAYAVALSEFKQNYKWLQDATDRMDDEDIENLDLDLEALENANNELEEHWNEEDPEHPIQAIDIYNDVIQGEIDPRDEAEIIEDRLLPHIDQNREPILDTLESEPEVRYVEPDDEGGFFGWIKGVPGKVRNIDLPDIDMPDIGSSPDFDPDRRKVLKYGGAAGAALLVGDYTNLASGDKNSGDGYLRGGKCGWDFDAFGLHGDQQQCETDTSDGNGQTPTPTETETETPTETETETPTETETETPTETVEEYEFEEFTLDYNSFSEFYESRPRNVRSDLFGNVENYQKFMNGDTGDMEVEEATVFYNENPEEESSVVYTVQTDEGSLKFDEITIDDGLADELREYGGNNEQ